MPRRQATLLNAWERMDEHRDTWSVADEAEAMSLAVTVQPRTELVQPLNSVRSDDGVAALHD